MARPGRIAEMSDLGHEGRLRRIVPRDAERASTGLSRQMLVNTSVLPSCHDLARDFVQDTHSRSARMLSLCHDLARVYGSE